MRNAPKDLTRSCGQAEMSSSEAVFVCNCENEPEKEKKMTWGKGQWGLVTLVKLRRHNSTR
jgi:hypothetical protein